MGAGFLAYGLWRISEAVIDTEGHGTGGKGMALRAAGLLSGVIHLGLASYSLNLVFGRQSSSGSLDGAEQGAATTLALPGGQTLLLIAAVILLVSGAYKFTKAYKLGFLHYIGSTSRDAILGKAGGSGRLCCTRRGFPRCGIFVVHRRPAGQGRTGGRYGRGPGILAGRTTSCCRRRPGILRLVQPRRGPVPAHYGPAGT